MVTVVVTISLVGRFIFLLFKWSVVRCSVPRKWTIQILDQSGIQISTVFEWFKNGLDMYWSQFQIVPSIRWCPFKNYHVVQVSNGFVNYFSHTFQIIHSEHPNTGLVWDFEWSNSDGIWHQNTEPFKNQTNSSGFARLHHFARR